MTSLTDLEAAKAQAEASEGATSATRLNETIRRVAERLRAIEIEISSLGGSLSDSGDDAQRCAKQNDLLATALALRRLQESLLRRLQNGTVVRCELCDDVIGKERLDAWPGATRCVPCERLQRGEYGPQKINQLIVLASLVSLAVTKHTANGTTTLRVFSGEGQILQSTNPTKVEVMVFQALVQAMFRTPELVEELLVFMKAALGGGRT